MIEYLSVFSFVLQGVFTFDVLCGSPRTQSQRRYQLYSCAGGARYAATRVLLPGLILTYRVLNLSSKSKARGRTKMSDG